MMIALEFREQSLALEGFHAARESPGADRGRRSVRTCGDDLRGLWQRALHHVAQLANVSRPGIALELFHCVARKILRLPAVLLRQLPREMLRENADVLAAFPQRRKRNRKHENAVI